MKKFRDYYERIPREFLSKKTIRVMKLTIFLSMMSFLQLMAGVTYSQSTKLTLKIEDIKISDALREIENQSEFYFLYSPKLVDVERTVSIEATNESIKDILSKIFDDKVKFVVVDRQIILTPSDLKSPSAEMQQPKITGVVTDETGSPLPGVNVHVEGTTNGTISDENGKYSLTISDNNAVLIFSFMGYKTQRVPLSGKTIIDITLANDLANLDEVVVIGYGTVKRKDLTGSVSSIKTAEISRLSTNNPLQSMQGKIAGLDVTQTSGATGSEIYVNLRGNRSINASNSPLFLVDGIDYGSSLDINASDIASIDVLKDASSTAIYGTRGANGVIIITTKRGLTEGARKTKVSINSSLSLNSPTNLPKKMNVQDEYLFMVERQRYADESVTGAWGSTSLSNYPPESILSNVISSPYEKSVYQIYKEGGINPYNLVFHNSVTSINDIAITGGDAKTSFSLSLGYMKQNGILHNDNQNRYNFRITLDHKITQNLKTGVNLLYTYRDWNRRDDGIYYALISMYSISEPYLADGSLLTYPSELGRSYSNPLLNEVPGYYQNNLKNSRLFGNMYVEWEIVKDLRLKSVFGLDTQSQREGDYEDFMTKNLLQNSQGSTFSALNSGNVSYTSETTLNYSLLLGRSQIELLAGQHIDQSVSESHGMSGIGAMDHYLKSSFYDLSFIPIGGRNISNTFIKTNLLSYFGRVNYKFMDKYLLTGTIRGDGSSVFAPGHKWGYFPSLAGAWIMSEEPFLKSIDKISNLKLRLSWGRSGNSAIYAYQTLTVLGIDKIPYNFDSGVLLGQVPVNLGNSDLSWETTSVYDAGLDLSLFKSRVSATLDFYDSKTYDLLLYRGLPATSVFPQVLQNVGNTKNVGFEAALNLRIIQKKNFSWSTDITYSTNKDKIVSLASGQTQDVSIPDAALIVGQPVQAFYNYQADGCWKISEATEAAKFGKIPGDVKIKDLNNDGVINELDRRTYNKSPKFILGWSNTLTYKGVSLSALVYSRVGQWISYDLNTLYLPTGPGSGPVLDYWTPEHQNAKFPRPGIDSWADLPPLAFEQASFVKIKEVTLSYTFPEKAISRLGLGSLRVYGSLQNYFTFSNLNNYDPERGGSYNDPLLKQMVFGVNLEF